MSLHMYLDVRLFYLSVRVCVSSAAFLGDSRVSTCSFPQLTPCSPERACMIDMQPVL